MNWVIDHWVEIIAVLGSLHALASAITALTPTPKDDEFVSKVYKMIESLALVIGRAKE